MYLVIWAHPQCAINFSVMDNDEMIYDTVLWYDDIIPEVNDAKQEYNIEKAYIYGPKDYVEKIVDNIRKYTGIIAELGE